MFPRRGGWEDHVSGWAEPMPPGSGEQNGRNSVSSAVFMPNSADPLRIAMVAPPWFDVPPPAYGGVEAVVADLVDDLAARGHEVTLIGAGRHLPTAPPSLSLWPHPPTPPPGEPFPHARYARLGLAGPPAT